MTSLCVPGLLLDGQWIPPIRSYGGTAPQLAEIIISAGRQIFPSYHVSRFDLTLGEDLEEPVAVDLALVSKALDAWYLALVEPAGNADLESLISRLGTAYGHPFGVREASELVRQIDEVTVEEARVLVHNNPRLIVLTDDPRHNWTDRLTSSNVRTDVMIVEPFRYLDSYVIRVNGQSPTEIGMDVIATCIPHPLLSNCLIVTWRRPITIPPTGALSLKYGHVDTEWDLLQGDGKWQLQPRGPFPLQEDPPFEIVQSSDGGVSIRRAPN